MRAHCKGRILSLASGGAAVFAARPDDLWSLPSRRCARLHDRNRNEPNESQPGDNVGDVGESRLKRLKESKDTQRHGPEKAELREVLLCGMAVVRTRLELGKSTKMIMAIYGENVFR